MKTFIIKTLGCKVNQFESDALERELAASGWSPTGDSQSADLVVINTCAVTQKAAMQSRQAARQAARQNPGACIVVTGCYAQIEPQRLDRIDGVNAVIPQSAKADLGRMLAASGKVTDFHAPGRQTDARPAPQAFPEFRVPSQARRTRAYLKVQDGCNAFCTYCIVPHARGRSRSMAPGDVSHAARELGRAGFREIILTGIHLGCYGLDLRPQSSLEALLTRLEAERPASRLRVSSIEPLEITPRIIDLMAASQIICPHLHIPLQSGDDGILSMMKRPYSASLFKDLVWAVHEKMPQAAIGADILVGFPGENDAAFEHTRALIDSLPISYLHVFPFSPRSGTPAATFPNPVKSAVIKARCKLMRELGQRKKEAFYAGFINKQLDVLIEREANSFSKTAKGTSANYIPVHIREASVLKNRYMKVMITQVDSHGRVFGMPV